MKLLKKNTSINTKSRRMMSLFECPRCGNKVERRTNDGLKQNKCCGGISKIAPKGSKLHNTYIGMTQRCWDANAVNYPIYGGRGITICKSWYNFDNFARWALENGFIEGLQIDRIDNNAGYSPSNCRFVDRIVNMNNTRKSILNKVSIDDMSRICEAFEYTDISVNDIANRYGISKTSVRRILNDDNNYVKIFNKKSLKESR